MKTNIAPHVETGLPQGVPELIDKLWKADHDPVGVPLRDPKDLALARNWLARVLLDTPALLEHIRLLEGQAYYHAEFPFPASRRDRWDESQPSSPTFPPIPMDPALQEWWNAPPAGMQPSPPAASAAFRPRQPLAEESALQVVERGLDDLSGREVAALLLSPLLLCDLADRISIQLPAYWLPRMDQLGRELMKQHGLEAPRRHTGPTREEPSGEEDTKFTAAHDETTVTVRAPRPGQAKPKGP
jgi:hypothetical protein